MSHMVIVTDESYPGLNPVQFGYENCKEGHFYGPAIRTYWLIHFVISGFGTFKICDKEYHIRPGEMFVIPPYVETYYEADANKPWSYIWIGFTADGELPAPLPHTIKLPEAAEIFNAMKNCEDFSTGKSAYLCSRLWDLFALILGKEKTRNDYVKAAIDCIHSEYMTGITISEIAHRLNIERTYLYSLFIKKVGISPKQYLLNHRMNIAASILKNASVPVSTVCYSVGYSDIFTFSKMFKKHFGISPAKYSKLQM